MPPNPPPPPAPVQPVPPAKKRTEPVHSEPEPHVLFQNPFHKEATMTMMSGMIPQLQVVTTHSITFLKISMLHHPDRYYR